jgi:hypothetical protein
MTPLTPHLSHEQLCDVVLARSPHPLSSDFATLQDHLRACPACTAELANLPESLSLFREASTAFAHQQLLHQSTPNSLRSRSIRPLHRTVLHPGYWAAAAAAAILVVAALPLRFHQHPQSPSSPPAVVTPAHTTESDEALLEDINQTLSSPIPSPMQPLADPTDNSAANQSTSPKRNN